MNIYIVFETWMPDVELFIKKFSLKGYHIVHGPRGDKYGGVGIFLHSSIRYTIIQLGDLGPVQAVNFKVFSVYIPSKYHSLNEGEVLLEIKKPTGIIKMCHDVIIGGDLNVFHMALGSSYFCDKGLLLLEGLDRLFLLNDGSPARIPPVSQTRNTLDITWCSYSLFERTSWTVDTENLGSDHLVIKIILPGVHSPPQLSRYDMTLVVFWNFF